MVSRRYTRQENTRLRILRLLRDDPSLPTRKIAAELGYLNEFVCYVVITLIDRGLVQLGNFNSYRRKARYAYLMTQRSLSEKTTLMQEFVTRKSSEFEKLRLQVEALERELDEKKNVQA